MANKVYTNHTLEEYKKKYEKLGLKKVNIGDAKKDPTLLNGKSWWLIKDTYYEIPSNKGVKGWWSNLGKTGQIVACALIGAAVTTAVVVPTVIAVNNKNKNKTVDHKAVIDVEVENIGCSQKSLDNGALEVTLTYDTSKKELENLTINIGDQILVLNQDYTLNGNVIVINKDVLDSNKTYEITIRPVLRNKEEPVEKKISLSETSIAVNVGGSKVITASLSDKGTSIISAGTSSDAITITAKGDNTFAISGKKEGKATIEFTCDGYKSATCSVKVNPKQETNKEKFIRIYNEYNETYQNSTKVYTVEDIPFIGISDSDYDVESIDTKGSKDSRQTLISCNSGEETRYIDTNSNKDELNKLKDDDSLYTFKDDTIEYHDENATKKEELKNLIVNKYGYVIKDTYPGVKGVYSYIGYVIDPKDAPKEKIMITPEKLDLTIGQEAMPGLVAKLNNFEGTAKDISYTINGDNIITIESISKMSESNFSLDYKMTGKTGEAFITVTCDGYKSATCSVKVSPKQESNRDKFINKFQEYLYKYINSTSQYELKDIPSVVLFYSDEGKAFESTKITYDGEKGNRTTKVTVGGSDTRIDAPSVEDQVTEATLFDDDGFYTFGDGFIQYNNPKASIGEIFTLRINEYGYVESYITYISGKQYGGFSLNISGKPKKSLTKDEFIKASAALYNEFDASSAVYSTEQISNVVFYGEKISDDDIFEVTYNREDNGRIMYVNYTLPDGTESSAPIVNSGYFGENIKENLSDSSDAIYLEYEDGSLEYTYNAPKSEKEIFTHIKYNKFGYVEDYEVSYEGSKMDIVSCTYDGNPQEISEPVTATINVDSSGLIDIAKGNNVIISSVTEAVTKDDATITIAYKNLSGTEVIIPLNVLSKDQSKVLVEKKQFVFDAEGGELIIDLGDAVKNVELGDTLQFSDPTTVKTINVDTTYLILDQGGSSKKITATLSDGAKNKISCEVESGLEKDFTVTDNGDNTFTIKPGSGYGTFKNSITLKCEGYTSVSISVEVRP